MLLSQLIIRLGIASAIAPAFAFQSSDSKRAKNVLEAKREGYCSPSGPIESTHCLYETVESLNADLFPALNRLVRYPFFRHYKVDLFRECPFWRENGFCMNRDCGVMAADEADIPEKWRSKALGELRTGDEASCYFREQDFCYIEDDTTQDGEYIDLSLNPERFTGYAGDSAHQVWRAIYEENCFGLSEAGATAAPIGFSKLSEGWGTEMVKQEAECEEKRVYYRIISGLHASISLHICQEYLDQATGEWSPNLQCFVSRLGAHPERLSNVYFNAVLLLRAVARAAPYLEHYDISVAPTTRSQDSDRTKELRKSDEGAKQSLIEVIGLASSDRVSRGFDEADFFNGPDSKVLKDQFKHHFRNVSRIMDCVGCDKCRLWGKLQVSGLGTALKILFELDEKALNPKINPDLLQRSEVVALFNTLHRTSESLASVELFRKMYKETQEAEAAAAKLRIEQKSKSKRPQAPITTTGVILSALEAFRKSCRGCLETCWRIIARGPMRILKMDRRIDGREL